MSFGWNASNGIWSHCVFSTQMLCCTKFLVEKPVCAGGEGVSRCFMFSLQLSFSGIKEPLINIPCFPMSISARAISTDNTGLIFFNFLGEFIHSSQKNGQPGGVITQTDVPSPVGSLHFLSGIQGGVCCFREIPT